MEIRITISFLRIVRMKTKKITVVKSFKNCNITNAIDGTEDDMLYDPENEAETDSLSI